jgi:hypothetical protein
MATAIDKKKRKRTRRAFDASKLTPESLVTMQDIAEHSRYARGYLYNLHSRHRHGEADAFVDPVVDTARAVRFRWGDVLAWLDKHGNPGAPKKG